MGRPTKVLEHAVSYHVRINQVEGVNDESIKQWLDGLGVSYIVCVEDADDEVANTHYHIKCECPWERTKVVSELKRAFPKADNIKGATQHHSVTLVRDEDAMLKYVCKGLKSGVPPNIVGYYGVAYSAEMVEALKGKWWRDRVEMCKKRKVEKQTMRDVIDERVKDLPADAVQIAYAIIGVYEEYSKPVQTFAIEGLVKLYMVQKSKSYRRDLALEIANRCTFEHLNTKYQDKSMAIFSEDDI